MNESAATFTINTLLFLCVLLILYVVILYTVYRLIRYFTTGKTMVIGQYEQQSAINNEWNALNAKTVENSLKNSHARQAETMYDRMRERVANNDKKLNSVEKNVLGLEETLENVAYTLDNNKLMDKNNIVERARGLETRYNDLRRKIESTVDKRKMVNESLDKSYDRISRLKLKENSTKYYGNLSIGEIEDETDEQN